MRRLVITLLGLGLLAACSSVAPGATTASPASSAAASPAGSAPTSPATTAASTPTAPEPAPKAISISLADGKAEPNGERVELLRGQHLILTITSDRVDKVHVHGFDLEIPVKPGAKVTEEIVMDRVGRFEIESHEPVLTLLVLTVR